VTLQRMQARLAAWQSFREIAGATRTLAAGRALQWTKRAQQTGAFRERCASLAATYGLLPPPTTVAHVTLAIGTDTGLCGSLNRAVARALDDAERGPDALTIAVGHRLAIEACTDTPIVFEAPASFADIEQTGAQIQQLVLPLPAETTRVHIILATRVTADGMAKVETLRGELPTSPSLEPSVELTAASLNRTTVARLWRGARIVDALAIGARSESEARLRTMARAHDAAERRIAEQQRALARERGESITQEILDARRKPGRVFQPGAATDGAATASSKHADASPGTRRLPSGH